MTIPATVRAPGWPPPRRALADSVSRVRRLVREPLSDRAAIVGDIKGDPTATLPADGSSRRVTPRWMATSSWRLEATSPTPVILCGVG